MLLEHVKASDDARCQVGWCGVAMVGLAVCFFLHQMLRVQRVGRQIAEEDEMQYRQHDTRECLARRYFWKAMQLTVLVWTRRYTKDCLADPES